MNSPYENKVPILIQALNHFIKTKHNLFSAFSRVDVEFKNNKVFECRNS